MYNDKVLDDIIGIANALEQYNHDHWGVYPIPEIDGNMNISCFYADATYAHDCDTSAFRQGMIDNNLLTRRYMPDVPTDPRTGSRYVYGVSNDGKYYMVGGNYEESDGSFVAKTAGNLKKGYHLPSLIRAFNGPNFVIEDGTNLPYSPDHLIITATLQNMTDSGVININDADGDPVTDTIENGMKVYTGYEIFSNGSSLDIYFSDGSVSNLTSYSQLKIMTGTEVEENDKDGIITKIRIKLTSGKIWNKVARLASASEFNIETSSAIAGVRGTEFGVDAGANKVLLKSGEICRLDLVEDIPVDDIKNCSGTHAIADLTIDEGDDPKIIEMNAGAGTDSTTPNTEPLKTLMDTQSKRYLNDNIRPRIKSVEGLEITIANLRTYYGITGDDYSEAEFLAAFEIDGDPTGDSIPITPLGNDDYKLTLTSVPSTQIVLRFEDVGGPSSSDSIPITITAETNLSEEDLYAVEEEVEAADATEAVDCSVMMISGDVNYNVEYEATITWSITPQSCFEGEKYNVYFGSSLPTVPNNSTVPIDNDSYLITAPSTPGTDYFWKVEVDDMTAVSDNGSKIVPTTPTWCGDGEWDSTNEECDDTSMLGCIMIGADACTCNGDLGWKIKESPDTPDGNCECDISGAEITLRSDIDEDDIDNDPIPINSSLTWEVSPACAFEGADYGVFINGAIRGGGPLTSFSLTTLIPPLVPGDIYDWKISGGGINSAIGSFEVECTDMGTIENVIVDVTTDHIHPEFSWEFDPACTFESESTTIEIATISTAYDTPVGETTYEWPDTLSSGTYTFTLSNPKATTDVTGGFTITPATPAPVITGLVIDCSGGSVPGYCMSGGEVYPVNFTVMDATSCSADLTLISGLGTVGNIVPPVTTTGFDYNTGSDNGDVIRITAECTGSGGTDTEFIDVELY